jgi:hypothetical protein
MRCTAAGCAFDGWVPRRTRLRGLRGFSRRRWRRLQSALRPLLRAAAALAMASLAVGVGATVGAAWQQAHAPTLAEQRAALPPGEYHDGDPLPPAHPLRPGLGMAASAAAAATPLDLRGACVWGRPGRDPYRGSVAEALRTARLPQGVQDALLAKVAAHAVDDRLTIGNGGISAALSGRVFAAHGFAMTYGRTLCLETRVNFSAGHTEAADLYETRDARGRLYSVMVPQVCGNVSFIAAQTKGRKTETLSAADGDLPSQLRLLSAVAGGEFDGARSVPEPGTLACLGAALLAWALAAAARRRS